MADIRPSVSQGAAILASDYNNVQTKIARVMGTGDGTFGYGQTIASTQVAAGTIIDDTHWDNLRSDLVRARSHQSTVDQGVALTDFAEGNLIDDVEVTAYETEADVATTNRLIAGSNRFTTQPTVTATSGIWNGRLIYTVILDCQSANQARWFFNSSSRIRVDISMPGSFATGTKDRVWQDMINGRVAIVFSSGSLFTTNSIGFYSLTNSYQNLSTYSAAAGVYTENRAFVDVRCDVANNSNGGARYIYIRCIFDDNDVGDQTGTGPAVDEDVSPISVSAFTSTARNEYVSVDIPVVSIVNISV
jgi:hypothetical protein